MTNDFFASSTLSLVLAWLFSIPVILGVVAYIFFIFEKQKGIPRILSAWIGLCFLVFSPIRYILFQAVVAISYPVQSVYALLSLVSLVSLVSVPLVSIAFAFLYIIGFAGPFFSIYWIMSKPNKLRYFISAVAAPIIAFVGTLLFSLALPLAAITTHWFPAKYVIMATNGPAYYVFLTQSPAMIAVPPYFTHTAQTHKDYLRSHVALLYLSNDEHAYFLKKAYPELYEKFKETVSKL